MRRFVFQQGTSNKFWEIALERSSFTTRWGKLGTAGQSGKKSFPTEDKAKAAYQKIVAEKLKEGYVEERGGRAASGAASKAKSKAQAAGKPQTQPKPAEPKGTPAAAPKRSGPLGEARALVEAGKLPEAKKALVAIGGKNLNPPRRFAAADRAEFLELVAVATQTERLMREAIRTDPDAPLPTLIRRYELAKKLDPSNKDEGEIGKLLAANDPRGMARHRQATVIWASNISDLPTLKKLELALEGCEYAEKGLLQGRDARSGYYDYLSQLDTVFGDAEENGSCTPKDRPAVTAFLKSRRRPEPMVEMLALAQKVMSFSNPRKLDSADHDAAQWVALGLVATGKLAEGAKMLEKIRKNDELVWDDEHPKVFRKHGRVLSAAGHHAEAAKAFEKATELTERRYEKLDNMFLWADALIAAGDSKKALQVLAEVQEIVGNDAENQVKVRRAMQRAQAKAGSKAEVAALNKQIADIERVDIVALPIRKGSFEADELELLDLAAFAKAHPKWHDIAATRARALPVAPKELKAWARAKRFEDHPLFRPWRDQIMKIAAPAYALDEAKGGSILLRDGRAKLSVTEWPTCGACKEPLTFIFDLPLESVPAFTGGAKGNLVFLWCEECQPTSAAVAAKKGSALLSWERGATATVEHPEHGYREAIRYKAVPAWTYPWWSAVRMEMTDEPKSTAVHHLAGVGLRQAGEVEYANTVYNQVRSRPGSYVGGYPDWGDHDETPSCPSCRAPMHLFARINESPLDGQGGSGYFFLCSRTAKCGGLEKMTWIVTGE